MERNYSKVRTVAGKGNYRGYTEWSEGDILMGKLVGKFKDQYGKTGMEMLVEYVDFKKKEDEEGKVGQTLRVNATGGIADFIENEAEIGKHYEVEYMGTYVVDQGPYKGKSGHSVQITEVSVSDSVAEDVEL